MNDPDNLQKLLEQHLRSLNPEAEQETGEPLSESEELSSQSRRLEQMLGLLDSYKAPPPPTQFVDQIMDYIDDVTTLKLPAADSSLPPVSEAGRVGRSRFSLREMMALAACLALFVGLFVPSLSHVRNRQQQDAMQLEPGGYFARSFQLCGHIRRLFAGRSQLSARRQLAAANRFSQRDQDFQQP